MNGRRVLVVDDQSDMRTTLSGLLSDLGLEVNSASSRAEALEVMDSVRFHVVVSDVRLDECDEDNCDGLLLMHDIRRKWPTTPVLILTGHATVRVIQEALQPDRDGTSLAFGLLLKSEFDWLPDCVEMALAHISRKPDIAE